MPFQQPVGKYMSKNHEGKNMILKFVRSDSTIFLINAQAIALSTPKKSTV